MHRCGSRGAALASDAARRSDVRGKSLTVRRAAFATWFPFFFADSRRCGWDSAQFASNQVDSRRLRMYRPKPAKPAKWPIQADSGRNSNTLSHSDTRLSSLCSLRCACARLHWITLCLSVSALRLGVSTTTQHKCYSVGPWQRVAI